MEAAASTLSEPFFPLPLFLDFLSEVDSDSSGLAAVEVVSLSPFLAFLAFLSLSTESLAETIQDAPAEVNTIIRARTINPSCRFQLSLLLIPITNSFLYR